MLPMNRSDYFPYCVVFDGETRCRLLRGTSRQETHDSLIKRHRLADAFQNSPCDFVMDRARVVGDDGPGRWLATGQFDARTSSRQSW